MLSIRESTLTSALTLALLCGPGDHSPTDETERVREARTAMQAHLDAGHGELIVNSVFDADAMADFDPESPEGMAAAALAEVENQVRACGRVCT